MAVEIIKKKKKIPQQERFYATGRRKEASARVWLAAGSGKIEVNGKDIKDYFARHSLAAAVVNPLAVTKTSERFDVICTVKGSGLSGQAGAVSHGVSRAIVKADPALHRALSVSGLLTRDAREVERKKYGHRKARRSPQFSKR